MINNDGNIVVQPGMPMPQGGLPYGPSPPEIGFVSNYDV